MWPVTVSILPTFGALPQPMLLLMCQVWLLLLLRRFRPTFQLPLVAGDLKSICKIVDVFLPLKVLETLPWSLRHSSLLALVTLPSVKPIVPPDSDELVDHESCGLTCSKVNVVDDKSSKSNSTSGTRGLDHGTGDAAKTPSCDSCEVVAGNVGPDVSDSHAASNEAVAADDSQSAPPPPASSEVEMVDASAVRKRSRPPGLSDGDSSAPSLKKETKKGVRMSGVAGVLFQTVSRRETRSTPATVESRSTRSQ